MPHSLVRFYETSVSILADDIRVTVDRICGFVFRCEDEVRDGELLCVRDIETAVLMLVLNN